MIFKLLLRIISFLRQLCAVDIVENVDQDSRMTKLLKFFIAIRLIPVKAGVKKASFKLFSCNAFIYCLLFLGTIYLTLCIKIIWLERLFSNEKYPAIYKTTSLVFLLFLYLPFPLSPLFVAQALPSAPNITLAKDLKVPKNSLSFFISVCLPMFGGFLLEMENNLKDNEGLTKENQNENNTSASKVIEDVFAHYILPIFSNSLINLCWMVPLILVSSWMEKFIKLCQEPDIENHVSHSKYCLGLYCDIQEGFGAFFLFVFSLTQFFVIVSLYLALPIVTSLFEGFWLDPFVYATGMLSVSVALIINIVDLAFLLEKVSMSVKGLARPLRELLVLEHAKSERQIIKNIIKDIEEAGPLHGKGFFLITRNTLTGMMSVGITYIDLQVEFKMALASS